jgi:hypothetical protein
MQSINNLLFLICLTLISNSSYAQSNLSNFNGTWTGAGYQFDLNETWSIILKIDNGKYKIEYPSLHCSADLQFIKTENGKIYLREKIISGDCITNGILILEKSTENKLLFKWTYSDGKPGSTAELLKFY